MEVTCSGDHGQRKRLADELRGPKAEKGMSPRKGRAVVRDRRAHWEEEAVTSIFVCPICAPAPAPRPPRHFLLPLLYTKRTVERAEIASCSGYRRRCCLSPSAGRRWTSFLPEGARAGYKIAGPKHWTTNCGRQSLNNYDAHPGGKMRCGTSRFAAQDAWQLA